MTEIRHYCDICSELIETDRTLMVVKTGPARFQRPEIEVCGPCWPKLAAVLDQRPAGCVAGTPRASKSNRVAVPTAGRLP